VLGRDAAIAPQAPRAAPQTVVAMSTTAAAPEKKGGLDLGLIAYFALWYFGNYYYNITNKLCLKVR
jgi:hypothetical protein